MIDAFPADEMTVPNVYTRMLVATKKILAMASASSPNANLFSERPKLPAFGNMTVINIAAVSLREKLLRAAKALTLSRQTP